MDLAPGAPPRLTRNLFSHAPMDLGKIFTSLKHIDISLEQIRNSLAPETASYVSSLIASHALAGLLQGAYLETAPEEKLLAYYILRQLGFPLSTLASPFTSLFVDAFSSSAIVWERNFLAYLLVEIPPNVRAAAAKIRFVLTFLRSSWRYLLAQF